MYFVIIPLAIYLVIGSVALVLGLCYLFKILRVMKHQNIIQASSLEKLITKIGVFSVFYAIPAACVLAANFYQYLHLQEWLEKARNTPCFQNRLDTSEYFPSSNQLHPLDTLSRSWNYIDKQREFNMNSKTKTEYHSNSYNDLYISKLETNPNVVDADFQLTDSKEKNCLLKESVAFFLIYFCKISMSLLPGVMSLMWILSTKTLDSWINFFKQCCGR